MSLLERDVAGREAFLAALSGGASVTAACRAAGINRSTPYQWLRRGGDAELEAALEAARARGGRGRRAPPAPPDAGAEDLRAVALRELRRVLEGKETEDGVRVQAARLALAVTAPPKPTPAASLGPGGAMHEAAPVPEAERLKVLEGARAFLDGLKRGQA